MNDPPVAAAMLSAASGSQRKSTPNGRSLGASSVTTRVMAATPS